MLPVFKQLVGPPSETEAKIQALVAQQKVATSYEEWKDLSESLDTLLGNDVWRANPELDLYDYVLVARRLAELRRTRRARDYQKLLYIIRTTWHRNVGNIGNVNNYRHSLVGTKRLIEEYLEECEKCVACFVTEKTGLDDRHVLGTLLQTRRAIGRTALVLSGGGCYGLIHIGVIATLLEQGLLPRIILGSSAGAIVASILSVHHSSEISRLLGDVLSSEFRIFSDGQKGGVLHNVLRFLRTGNWFDNSHLRETMQSFLGTLTFREAYNRTGRILNVTVSPASHHEQPRLLNYITLPNVLIWSAVCASCLLPGVFAPSIIYEKDPISGTIHEWNYISVRFVDGSVDNDLPISRLSEMFNVDHIIACQVNPHVTPFLQLSVDAVGGEIEHELSARMKNYFLGVYKMFTSEITHYLEVAQEVGVARNVSKKLSSLLTQRYSGDITILPKLRILELTKLLVNPTPEYILDAAVRGARSTWPKIGIIRNHCGVEFLLDKTIQELRSRLILPSEKSPKRARSGSFSASLGAIRSSSHGNLRSLKTGNLRRQSLILTIDGGTSQLVSAHSPEFGPIDWNFASITSPFAQSNGNRGLSLVKTKTTQETPDEKPEEDMGQGAEMSKTISLGQ